MPNITDPNSSDPFNLNRFLMGQAENYHEALSELKAGRKRSHWMWYVFPQIDGLGLSSTSKYYAIKSVEEAHAYLQHPLLGPRLLECSEAMMAVEGKTANAILGSPDDLKLRSCATLFASVSPGSVFDRILERFFDGMRDGRTLDLLGKMTEGSVDKR